MLQFLRRLFLHRTYESEFARGVREAKDFASSHGLRDQQLTIGQAVGDRDMSQGINKAFAEGWLTYMREHVKKHETSQQGQ